MFTRLSKTFFAAALCAALLTTSAVRAFVQSRAVDVDAIAAQVEKASLSEDGAALKDARLNGLRLLATSGMPAEAVSRLRYTVAYAGWRLGFVPTLTRKEQGDLLADAKTQLEAVLAADPRNVEALGLLSGVYGGQIAQNYELGMTLGPLSGQVLGRALAIAPENPRLLLLKGQNQFHTPPEYGGSVREAEATFRRALSNFEKEPASTPWPNWGRFDAHAWLGQALADRRDAAGARAEYEAALKIAPNSNWVRMVLLPAVK